MPTITSVDFFIPTGRGQLFARRWTPPAHRPRSHQPEDAPPIVLLHDSLGCVELWRDFPERLAQSTGRAVIAYDRLGFGRSDPHPGTLDLRFVHDEADDGFRLVREHLALDRFVAMGHSVGGGMAVACAARHGRLCQGLITVSAQSFAEDRTLAGIREAGHSFAQPGQLDRLMKYHGDKAAWVLSAWVDNWLAPGFADWKLDDELRRVDCPVLALHGDQDEYGSPAHAERIARLTQGRAVILEGCGHVPHREQSERVLALIGDWLQDARR
ncbi:alpha/beta fold hydrolase [Bordetella sp. BOR01]|uniref:alpha/beta fold hydrolase n=1 Tax=Bordetella sp. BOR01 TaxID=2854779 RepID=UPI001C477AA4|nr:alpha/beta hydrolase [Bordetella sp. BOR01]MBV7481534.1 alpha/beta hydrolase [Bordetella sp. BOR01]